MPKRLIITKVCFRILQVIFVLVAILLVVAASPVTGLEKTPSHDAITAWMRSTLSEIVEWTTSITALILVLLALGMEFVVRALGSLRYGAWVVSIVICLSLILGSLKGGLVGIPLVPNRASP